MTEHEHEQDHDADFAAMSPEELTILVEDHGLEVSGTGKNDRVLKGDMVSALEAIHPTDDDQRDKTIKRQSNMAWWCPVCDHSNTLLTVACGNCKAVRDGDSVR